jgi:hypothetical protein
MEGAGIARTQAEAIAEGFAEVARDNLATKADLDVLYWKIVGAVAVLLIGYLAAVWGIVAANVP